MTVDVAGGLFLTVFGLSLAVFSSRLAVFAARRWQAFAAHHPAFPVPSSLVYRVMFALVGSLLAVGGLSFVVRGT